MKKLLIYSVILSFFISWIPNFSMQTEAAGMEDLGIAKDFNIFVFNNHIQQNSSSEGRVAVGNEADYSSISIGSSPALSESKDRYDLIVGKKITARNGSNIKGNTAIGIDGKVVEYTMTNNNRVEGNPFKEDIIDFNAAYNDLKYKSQNWARLTSNGNVENIYTTLTLTGADQNLNIFEVTTDELSLGNLSGLNLVVPESSTVLINVKGSHLKMGNYGIFLNGQSAPTPAGSRILWNFSEMKELQLEGISVIGTVLAPDATFSPSGSGQINGNLIVQNFYNPNGGFSLHNHLFNSKLPLEREETNLGSLEITKVDEDTKEKLAGAEFTLSQNGKVIKTGTTNEQGVLKFEDLPYGTYELTETKAPTGYIANNDVKTITIGEGDVQPLQITIKNKAEKPVVKTGSLEITKVDEDTKEKLAGAEFTLSQNGKVIKTGTTNEQGVLKFEDLPYGTYELTETKAPTGYIANNDVKTITIGEGDVQPLQITIKNKAEKPVVKTGSLEITKVDEDTKEKLAGAEFTLSQNGKVIKTGTTNEQGILYFGDLPYGIYKLKETKAPAGYIANNKVKNITIGEGKNQHIQLIIENKARKTEKPAQNKGSLNITKVDADTKEKLAGAEFVLLKDGEVIQKVTTNEDGTIKFEDLSFGTYELKETKPLVGYVGNNEVIKITIGEGENQHIQLTIEDKILQQEEKTGSLKITKVDADTKEKLAGAEFKLTQNGVIVKTGITNEDGIITFDNLSVGTYVLTETKAPTGYVILKQEEVITIDQDRLNIELTIDNKKSTIPGDTEDSSEGVSNHLSGGQSSLNSNFNDSSAMASDNKTDSNVYEKIDSLPQTGEVLFRVLNVLGILLLAAGSLFLWKLPKKSE